MSSSNYQASLLLKTSPQKARLVVNVIRGKKLSIALETLTRLNKGCSLGVYKLLKSAASNLSLKDEDFSSTTVKTIVAEEAQRLYRSMPRARGSAFKLRRRYSRVRVELEKV